MRETEIGRSHRIRYYSNSEYTTLSYAPIFEALWLQNEIYRMRESRR